MNSHNSIMENCRSIGIKACSEHGRSKRRRLVEGKENSESSAASRFMSNKATKDIVHEILLRVSDSKSAIQCSSVCKTWLSVVTSQNFINAFNRRHCSDPTQYTFFFRGINYKPVTYNLSFPETTGPTETATFFKFLRFPRRVRKVSVRASCDGFLLLSVSLRRFCICNPLTKQWRFLPRAPLHYGETETCGLSLEPNDHNNNNYNKVIKFKVVVAYERNVSFKANVFCSESRKWTKCETPFPQKVFCSESSIPSNGIVYWLGCNHSFAGIFAYNPFETDEVKRYRYVNTPDVKGGRRCHVRIGSVRGRLRFSGMLQVEKSQFYTLKIWERQDWEVNDGEEWRLVHDVRLRLPQESMVIGFHPHDGNVMFLSCGRDVCRYEIEEEKLQKVGRIPMNDTDYRYVCKSVFWLATYTVAQPPSWPKLIPRLRRKKIRYRFS